MYFLSRKKRNKLFKFKSMTIGIGCDIVDHSISMQLEWETNLPLIERIFTKKEVDMYNKQKSNSFLCGRFAAKEAVLKCLGIGMIDGLKLTEIEILQYDSGRPILELHGKVKQLSDSMAINNWHISISHSKDHSIAVVLAEKL